MSADYVVDEPVEQEHGPSEAESRNELPLEQIAPATNSDRAMLVTGVLIDAYLYAKARGADHGAAIHILSIIASSPALVSIVFKE